MTQELLPCPFCGGGAAVSSYTRLGSTEAAGFYVECNDCSAGGQPFDTQGESPDRVDYTKGKAVAAWNRRASFAGIENPAAFVEAARGMHEAAKVLWRMRVSGECYCDSDVDEAAERLGTALTAFRATLGEDAA